MSRMVVFLLLVVAVASIHATSMPYCGPNGYYSSCGSSCQATCENPTPSGACTMECVSGCSCNEGYVKNSEGNCVLTRDC